MRRLEKMRERRKEGRIEVTRKEECEKKERKEEIRKGNHSYVFWGEGE